MIQVHKLTRCCQKDRDKIDNQQRVGNIECYDQNGGFFSQKQAEKLIKLAMISDTKECKIKIILDQSQATEVVSLLAARFRIQQHLSETVDEQTFSNIYYPTCLITNSQVYRTFANFITSSYYILHVIIIQKLGYFQDHYAPITKVMRMDERQLLSAIQQQMAHNFIVGRDAKLDEFKYKIRDILQVKRSRKFYRRKWRKYLRITGFGQQQAKDFMDKNRPDTQNVLRLYSENTHIYQINVILRRCNNPSVLNYLALMVQLLYQAISASVIPRQPLYGLVCYRGGSIGTQEVNQLLQAQVEPILCRYFMSCSLNPIVAEAFRTNCIFQIHFQPDSGCVIIRDSVYKQQEEVIFSVLSRFRVMSVQEDRMREDQGWYVVLSYDGPANIDLI